MYDNMEALYTFVLPRYLVLPTGACDAFTFLDLVQLDDLLNLWEYHLLPPALFRKSCTTIRRYDTFN